MDYGLIIRRSFQFAWQHKALWIFGLFIMGVGSLNIELTGGPFASGDVPDFSSSAMSQLVLPFLGVYFLIVILSIVTYCISAPALVDAANRLGRGGRYSFSTSLSAGIDYFFRSLGLIILIGIIAMAIIAVMAAVAVVIGIMFGAGFEQGDTAAMAPAIIMLILAGVVIGIPIFLFILWFITTIQQLAQRAIVVRDVSIADSLGEAWFLLKAHFWKCVVIFLIYMAFAFGNSMVLMIIFTAIKFVVSGALLPGGANPGLVFVVNLLLGLPFSIVIGGFTSTTFFNFYTLFYFALVDPASMREPQSVVPQPLA
jgi:hypothetical protein